MPNSVVLSKVLPRILKKVNSVKIYLAEETNVYWAEVYKPDGSFLATWAITLEELFYDIEAALQPKKENENE